MTNELPAESRPSSLESLVLTSFLSRSRFAVASFSGVILYDRFSAVIFNSVLSPA